MQEEKKFGIMLSMGISKIYIIGQFIVELVIISVLAFMISYFVANYSAKNMANNILTNVTKEITTKGEKEAKSSNISGGAELDGYNKTLTKIDIKIGAEDMIYVIILGSIVILIALFVGSYKIMRKHPKTLLTDIE